MEIPLSSKRFGAGPAWAALKVPTMAACHHGVRASVARGVGSPASDWLPRR